MEIWKPVVSYEGYYSVSDHGNVRRELKSGNTYVGKIIKGGYRKGYRFVGLYKDSVPTTKKVHHLVMEAFVGTRPKNLVVNHIDGDKSNNLLSNLEYITEKDNKIHAGRHGLMCHGERHRFSKLTDDKVINIRKEYAMGDTSGIKLGKKYNVNRRTIIKIVNKKCWKHIQ